VNAILAKHKIKISSLFSALEAFLMDLKANDDDSIVCSLIDMSATRTLVSYFSFENFSGSVSKRAKAAIVYFSLRFLQTDPDFSDVSFGSYLFFLAIIDGSRTFYAGNATLDYHLLSSVL